MVPAGFICIWPYSLASIPSGWGVVTELYGRFPKGSAVGVNPNIQGDGSHYHTSPAHQHTPVAHNHTVALANSTYGGKNTGSTTSGGPYDNHYHPAQADPLSQVSGGLLSAVNATYASVITEPMHRRVIFIKALTSVGGIPHGAIVLTDSSGFVNNTGKWKGVYIADGANGSVNVVGKFLKGASAGQGSDLVSDLGTSTHQHAINHTHVETGHGHPAFNSAQGAPTGSFETASGTADAVRQHSHLLTLSAVGMGWAGTPYSGYIAHEPPFKKLLPVQNLSGHVVTVKDMIGLWTGTLASVPKMLAVCDGVANALNMAGQHLKTGFTVADNGGTGGNATHTHSDSHYHTGGTHTHGVSVEFRGATNNAYNDGHKLPAPHTHGVSSNGSKYADWSNVGTTANASSHEPPYSTVAFVKITKVSVGGSILLLLT